MADKRLPNPADRERTGNIGNRLLLGQASADGASMNFGKPDASDTHAHIGNGTLRTCELELGCCVAESDGFE
ncbi:hypothetical protein [Derxia lacustris]|uniref:hypothetical protein n=1 Tax=Derxia lacustris TaxID=764842 RepID=UPI00111C6904|nr:hypothetical protein [Derxia lacustris]